LSGSASGRRSSTSPRRSEDGPSRRRSSTELAIQSVRPIWLSRLAPTRPAWRSPRSVGGGGSYGRWTDASWNWTLGVNLMSVVWGVEIFGPLIEAHGEGGPIVSTASIAGLIAGAGPAYSVTKYGVVALSEGLRVRLAPLGIGVSVLCPGFIRTKIMNSERNVPQRFAGPMEQPPTERGIPKNDRRSSIHGASIRSM